MGILCMISNFYEQGKVLTPFSLIVVKFYTAG